MTSKDPDRFQPVDSAKLSTDHPSNYGYDPSAPRRPRTATWRKSVVRGRKGTGSDASGNELSPNIGKRTIANGSPPEDEEVDQELGNLNNYRPNFGAKSSNRSSGANGEATGRSRVGRTRSVTASSGGSRRVAKPITPKTFESPFNAKGFVQDLTLAAPNFATPTLVKLFHAAIHDMQKLTDKLAKDIDRAVYETSITETSHRKLSSELIKSFSGVSTRYEKLERMINDVGSRSVRVGEQLSNVEKRRKNAENAKKMIELLKEFQEKTRIKYGFDGGNDGAPKRKTRHKRPVPSLAASAALNASQSGNPPPMPAISEAQQASGQGAPTTGSHASLAPPADPTSGSTTNVNGTTTPPSAFQSRRPSAQSSVFVPETPTVMFVSPISLDPLRKTLPGQLELAIILRRLSAIIKELEVPSYDVAKSGIERYCETFETDMLAHFQRGYDRGDLNRMAESSRVLIAFNGGNSVIQTYINQHEFFMGKHTHDTTEMSVKAKDLGKSIGGGSDYLTAVTEPVNPRDRALDADPALSSLYSSVRDVVQSEWSRIAKVFPEPAKVLQSFLERVFAQSVEQTFEAIVSRARARSTHAYLRCVCSSHVATVVLIRDLQDFFESVMAKSEDSEPKERENGIAAVPKSWTSLSASNGPSPRRMLDHVAIRSMEDLFVPYVENGAYIQDEQHCMKEVMSNFLSDFYMHVDLFQKQLAAKKEIDGRSRGKIIFGKAMERLQAYSARSMKSEMGSSAQVGGSTLAMEAKDSTNSIAEGDISLSAARDVRLDKDTATKILKFHGEALNRCLELSDPLALVMNVVKLWRCLLEQLTDQYVFAATDVLLEYWHHHDFSALMLEGETTSKGMNGMSSSFSSTLDKVHPSGSFFGDLQSLLSQISTAQSVAELVQYHFETAVLPSMSGNASISGHQEVSQMLLQVTSDLEDRLNALVTRLLEVLKMLMKELLSKQGKHDYKPGDDMLTFGLMNSDTCVATTNFFSQSIQVIKATLSGTCQELILGEMANGLYELLVEHYTKFTISLTGSMILTRDLTKYYESVHDNVVQYSSRFEMLRELGNLFVVRGENLSTIMEESTYLGKMGSKFVQPFLMCREDWSKERFSL